MYNEQLVYRVVIWAFCGISLWTEKVALNRNDPMHDLYGILIGSIKQCCKWDEHF